MVVTPPRTVADQVTLPQGYTLKWSVHFNSLQHVIERLKLVVPATLGIVFLLIYMVFRRAVEATPHMLTVPLALLGGL